MSNYLPYLKHSLNKQAQDYGDPLKELSEGDIANYVLQHHRDDRRRDAHYDLRLGTPKNKGLFSWAVPKAELPEQGTRKAVFQTPIHPHSYDKIQGRVGTSDVRIHRKGKALINKVTPNTFSFTVEGARTPIKYSLVKLPPRGHKRTWLLVNSKPKEGGIGGKIIEGIDDNDAIEQAVEMQKNLDVGVMKVADIIKRAQNLIPETHRQKAKNPELLSTIERVVKTLGGGPNAVKLLYGTAGTESGLGKHPNTYNLGGIFQVDPVGFKATQDVGSHPKLRLKHQKIKNDFGIDWTKVKYDDMRNDNLLNTIAARLYYSNEPKPIPATREGRAEYWKKVYNTMRGKGKPTDYLQRSDPDLSKITPKVMPNYKMAKEKPMEKRIDCQAVPVDIVSSDGNKRKKITVEIADNEDTRRKGLSKRADLPKDHGMLFTKSGAFWMKDCLIPLDIAFIAKDGTIVDKQAMDLSDEPDYLKPIYVSRDPSALYALEMPKGWFDANNISVKDKIVCRN